MAKLTRRQFLRSTLGTAAALTPTLLTTARAAPSWLMDAAQDAEASQRVLVVIQLAGGNDGLSTVTPWEDDLYYRGRATIGIPKHKLIRLDDHNGFHPNLSRLATRFEHGQVGIHQAVGYPDPNLSHFRSQDIWDSASTAGTLPATGWMGELNDQLGTRDAMAMIAVGRDSMPLALRAEQGVACVVPNLASYRIQNAPKGSSSAEADARARAIAALNGGAPMSGTGDERQRVTKAYTAATTSIAELGHVQGFETRNSFPDHKLGADLRLIARALGAGLPTRFFYVTHDGFDTHTDQVGMQGRLLGRLDGAVDAFLREMGAQGRLDEVLVMCVSEFGRRVEECGVGDTAGSDHGAANSMMFFGGKVNPGLHGPQPDLEHLDEDGNLAMRVDFRQAYTTVIRDWMGGDPEAILGPDFPALKVLAS